MWWKRCVPSSPSSSRRPGASRRARRAARRRSPRAGRDEHAERGRGEMVADDGGGLDHRALVARERVQARGEQRLDRRGDGELREVTGRAPLAVLLLDQPLVGEHPQELLDVERVALGRVDDPVEDVLVESCAAEERLDHRPARRPRRAVTARSASRAPAAPVGRSQQEPGRVGQTSRRGRRPSRRRVGRQLEQRVLRPVDVLDRGGRPDARPRGARGSAALPRRAPRSGTDRALADHRGEPTVTSSPAGSVTRGACRGPGRVIVVDDARACSVASASGQKVMPSPYGETPAREDERVARDPPDVNSAVSVDLPTPASATSVTSCGARAVVRPSSKSVVERRELLLAADERRSGSSGATAPSAHADEPVGGNRLGLPLQAQRLDLLDLDVVADERVRERPDQDLALAGCLLEAGRDVDRIAGDEPLARGRVAGDHLARVDAGAVREADAVDLARAPRSAPRGPPASRRPRARRGGRRPRGAVGARRRPSRRRR